jgi:ABC-type phosphate/phosphonate transport system ATPase subunit
MPVATEVTDQWPGKEQVVNDVPKVIKELHFGVLYGDNGEGKKHSLTLLQIGSRYHKPVASRTCRPSNV